MGAEKQGIARQDGDVTPEEVVQSQRPQASKPPGKPITIVKRGVA